MTTPSEEVATIADMAAAIGKVLAGHPAPLQGAALADCLAMWLAGHHVAGDKHTTRKMRAELLAMHCALVRSLVPQNAKQIGTTP